VAFTALFPIITVLAYGQLAVLKERISSLRSEARKSEEVEKNAL